MPIRATIVFPLQLALYSKKYLIHLTQGLYHEQQTNLLRSRI